jgi:hypothetical protein
MIFYPLTQQPGYPNRRNKKLISNPMYARLKASTAFKVRILQASLMKSICQDLSFSMGMLSGFGSLVRSRLVGFESRLNPYFTYTMRMRNLLISGLHFITLAITFWGHIAALKQPPLWPQEWVCPFLSSWKYSTSLSLPIQSDERPVHKKQLEIASELKLHLLPFDRALPLF